MVRSHVETRAGPAVGIYMVMAREYMEHFLQPGVEKEVKAAIRNAGGSYNQSGLFLASTSNETTVNRKTGINRRSVVYIPRVQVPKETLAHLDNRE